MTREQLITKGEKQLKYIQDRMNEAKTKENKEHWSAKGIAMLDMLFILLDENYENYNSWFENFFYYDRD